MALSDVYSTLKGVYCVEASSKHSEITQKISESILTMGVSSCVVVGGILLVAIIIALIWAGNKNKEGFRQCGRNEFALNDAYAEVLDVPVPQSVVQAPAVYAAPLATRASTVDAAHFASMINDGDSFVDLQAQADDASAGCCGAQRLKDRYNLAQQRDAFPKMPACCSQFGVDTTLASAGAYGLSIPTVSLKDPLWLRSDMLRGDVPITFNPIALVDRSQYGIGSLNDTAIFRNCGRRNLNVKYEGLTVEGPNATNAYC